MDKISQKFIVAIPVADNEAVSLPEVKDGDNMFATISNLIEYAPARDEILCFPLSNEYSLWVAEDSVGNMPVNKIATLAFASFYDQNATPFYGDAVITGPNIDNKPVALTAQAVYEFFELLAQTHNNKETDNHE